MITYGQALLGVSYMVGTCLLSVTVGWRLRDATYLRRAHHQTPGTPTAVPPAEPTLRETGAPPCPQAPPPSRYLNGAAGPSTRRPGP